MKTEGRGRPHRVRFRDHRGAELRMTAPRAGLTPAPRQRTNPLSRDGAGRAAGRWHLRQQPDDRARVTGGHAGSPVQDLHVRIALDETPQESAKTLKPNPIPDVIFGWP